MKYLSVIVLAISLLAACSQPEETAQKATVEHRNYVRDQYGETAIQQYLHLKDALVSSRVQEAPRCRQTHVHALGHIQA